VARVIDVATLENGATYMVMEYLEGGDLSSWLAQRGVLPIEQAVDFILQACEAVAEAHSLGIVHRDLKPANLFCIRRPDGVLSIKVLDFGISKVKPAQFLETDAAITRTTAVMGSPPYMSPEQLQASRSVDTRTDIWSLGAVLFQLLSGQPPFAGESLPDLCIKIANDPAPLVRRHRPDIPELLEKCIVRCLQKDREHRYRNVAELAVALTPFGSKRARGSIERIKGIIQSAGLSVSTLELPPSSDESPPTPHVQTEAAWGHTAPPAAGRKKWLALGLFFVVAALGLAATFQTKFNPASHKGVASSTAAQLPTTTEPSLVATLPSSPIVAATPIAPAPAADAGDFVAAATNPALWRDAKTISGKNPKRVAERAAAKANQPAQKSEPGPTATKTASKLDCDPPYNLDAQGRKHFKPECYVNQKQ
jgi:serine/threonine-protein kinase